MSCFSFQCRLCQKRSNIFDALRDICPYQIDPWEYLESIQMAENHVCRECRLKCACWICYFVHQKVCFNCVYFGFMPKSKNLGNGNGWCKNCNISCLSERKSTNGKIQKELKPPQPPRLYLLALCSLPPVDSTKGLEYNLKFSIYRDYNLVL